MKFKNSSIYAKFLFFSSSVPTFVNMPEETLIKIADVLEEVRSNEGGEIAKYLAEICWKGKLFCASVF